ncbi:hypothetical protein [Planococcus halocryophilus]|uniref:hypothetical protein n=1 Tax=Planococcus halocryophilus TaxID=1215089 RepID=UPI0012DDB022|nr:hypothetical protein [Planococcus halocryophilus]
MINSVEGKNFKVTPLFHYIQRQAEAAGLHVHWANAKETLQLFENKESLRLGNAISELFNMKEVINI